MLAGLGDGATKLGRPVAEILEVLGARDLGYLSGLALLDDLDAELPHLLAEALFPGPDLQRHPLKRPGELAEGIATRSRFPASEADRDGDTDADVLVGERDHDGPVRCFVPVAGASVRLQSDQRVDSLGFALGGRAVDPGVELLRSITGQGTRD
jgi:hypothetical protein